MGFISRRIPDLNYPNTGHLFAAVQQSSGFLQSKSSSINEKYIWVQTTQTLYRLVPDILFFIWLQLSIFYSTVIVFNNPQLNKVQLSVACDQVTESDHYCRYFNRDPILIGNRVLSKSPFDLKQPKNGPSRKHPAVKKATHPFALLRRS